MKRNFVKAGIILSWLLTLIILQPVVGLAGSTAHFKWLESDTSFVLYGTGRINGADIPVNSEVVAIDGNGTVIGAVTVTQAGNWMLTAYADDSNPATCQDLGAVALETIKLKIYESGAGNVYLAPQTAVWSGTINQLVLVSLDVTNANLEGNAPPYVSDQSPAPDSSAPADTTISFHLRDTSNIDPSTINVKVNCQAMVANGQDQTGGSVGVNADNPQDVVITILNQTPYACTDQVEVIVNASDTGGQVMPQVFYSFSIADNDGPAVNQAGLTPAPGDTEVASDTSIVAHITDSCSGVQLNSITMTVDGTDVTSLLIHSGTPADRVVTYKPSQNFSYGSTVNVVLDASDAAGNQMAQSFAYSFTTTSDNLPPTVAGLSPADQATGVAPGVSVVFHVQDSGTGVNPNTINLLVNGISVNPSCQLAGGQQVDCQITGSAADYTVTYKPSQPFSAGQVNVQVDAQDSANNSITPSFTYAFTIAAGTEEDTTPPVVSDQSPAAGATDVSPSAAVVLKIKDLQSGVDKSTINLTVGGSKVAPVITGDASGYTVTYRSPVPFTTGQTITVAVSANDLSPSANPTTANYSFTVGKAPYVTSLDPVSGATQVSYTQPVSFHIQDDESGVDINSVSVKIANTVFNTSNPALFSFSGNAGDYTVTVGHSDFTNNQLVNVTISASDLAGNAMPTYSYSFTAADLTAPEDVTSFAVQSGDRKATLNWTASANTAGDLAGYTLFITQNGGEPVGSPDGIAIGPGTVNYVVTNLQNKVEYTFKIVARDLHNLSPGVSQVATPQADLISIEISPTQATSVLALALPINMQAKANYSDNTQEVITEVATWNSSAPVIGTVSAQGVFTALGQGVTNITATWNGKESNIAVITVTVDVDFTLTRCIYYVATGAVNLTWSNAAGQTYDLQYSDDLYSDNNMTWTLVEGDITPGDGGITTYIDDGSKTGEAPGDPAVAQRYYRVAIAGLEPAVYSSDWCGIFSTQLVEGMNLVSFPLIPESALINVSIGSQIEGATVPQNADRVWFWDKVGKKYDYAWLSTRTDRPGWLNTAGVLSNLSLDPDKGF